MTHPLYARPLVNRNVDQTNRHYIMGGDAWVPTLPDGLGEMGPREDPLKAPRAPTLAKIKAQRGLQVAR